MRQKNKVARIVKSGALRSGVLLAAILMTVATIIPSCSSDGPAEETFLKYLAVQKENDNHWSIVEEDGKEVVKDNSVLNIM